MQQRNSSEQSRKRRTEHIKWISARDIGFTIAIAATVAMAICACGAVDKHEEDRLAEKEPIQTAVIQAVKPRPEVDKPIVEPEAAEPEVETVMLWDVPLDAELQLFIIQSCEDHHIDPAIVIAVIERESSYRASVIGDNGEAFGLMQVQPKWHRDRMDKLGVTDLLDPFQNVTVGMDYLFELLDEGKGLERALAAYNQGPDEADLGLGFGYAAEVLTIKENLKERVIECALD